MKKFITAVKCVLVLVVLCAAMLALTADIFYTKPVLPSQDPNDDQPITPPDDGNQGNEKPNVPDAPDENIPNWSIKPVVIKNSISDKSGKILCEIRYSYPSASSNDESDISSFTKALDEIANDIKIYVDSRSELYKLRSYEQFSVPPQITGYYTINRFSSELLSISFIFSEISPDAGINESRINYNLDILLESSEITIDAVMNDAVSSVKEMLASRNKSGELALYANYEKLLSGMINNVWSVRSNGIMFYFPCGTIAPVSDGDIEVFIEKSALSTLLSEYGKILLNVTG